MKLKAFSAEKRKEFLALPPEEIFRLYARLTKHGQELIRAALPPAKKPGFRPHTDEVVKAQIKKWLGILAKTVDTGEHWRSAEHFASGWIEHLPPLQKGLPRLKQILDDFDNSADFPASGSVVPANSSLDIKCFDILREASKRNEIDQDTIRSIYRIAYFLRDPRIEQIIDSCISSEQLLAHRNVLNELRELREGLGEVRASLSHAEDSTLAQAEQTSSIEANVSALEVRLNEVAALHLENKRLWEKQELRLNSLKDELKTLEGRFAEQTKQKSQAISADSVDELLAKLAERMPQSRAEATPLALPKRTSTSVLQYPNETLFLSQLGYQLERTGLVKGDPFTCAALLYAGLVSSTAVSCSLNLVETALLGTLNPQEDTLRMIVESNWMEPRWHEMLRSSRPDVAAWVISQGVAPTDPGISAPVLIFKDFDRCFPEAYLLSLLKTLEPKLNREQNAIVLASRCQDSVRVFPGVTVYELFADVDFLFRRALPTAYVEGPQSLCHLSREQWNQWRTERLKMENAREKDLVGICEKVEEESQRELAAMKRGAQRYLRVAATLVDSGLAFEAAIAATVLPCASILGVSNVIAEVCESIGGSTYLSAAIAASSEVFSEPHVLSEIER